MEKTLRIPSAQKKWYLSVIDEMARSMPVWTCSTKGLQWCEVDYHADLKLAEKVVSACGTRSGVDVDRSICQTTGVTLT
jgi:hypothetical protein